MKILAIKDKEQLHSELEGNTIIDFYADWCGPCKTLSKTFDMLEEEHAFDDLTVIKVNVDNFPDIASDYGVKSLPTMIFTESSKIVETKIGYLSKTNLFKMISETYEYSK